MTRLIFCVTGPSSPPHFTLEGDMGLTFSLPSFLLPIWFFLFLLSAIDSEACKPCIGEVPAPNLEPEAVLVPIQSFLGRGGRGAGGSLWGL